MSLINLFGLDKENKILKILTNRVGLFFPLLPLVILFSTIGLSYLVTNYLGIQTINEFLFYETESAREYLWRILWACLFIIIIIFSMVICWHSVKVIHDNTVSITRKSKLLLAVIIFIFIAALVLGLLCGNSIFGVVTLFLSEAQSISDVHIPTAVAIQLSVSSVTIILITISSCALIYLPGRIQIETIKRKNRDFKRSFYLTSAYLGIGVVQFFCLFTWANYAAGEIDTHKTLILAITLGSSILYTLFFTIMFVPVSIQIRIWTELLASDYVDIYNSNKFNEWKKLNGLYDSPRNNLKQLVLLMSPILIGVFSGVISNILNK